MDECITRDVRRTAAAQQVSNGDMQLASRAAMTWRSGQSRLPDTDGEVLENGTRTQVFHSAARGNSLELRGASPTVIILIFHTFVIQGWAAYSTKCKRNVDWAWDVISALSSSFLYYCRWARLLQRYKMNLDCACDKLLNEYGWRW
jgi:hypothetical protein